MKVVKRCERTKRITIKGIRISMSVIKKIEELGYQVTLIIGE